MTRTPGERDERVARAQAEADERAGDEFDERNNDADNPERPDRQKRVGERQKIFPGVVKRAELKHFHHSGHQEDEAEDRLGVLRGVEATICSELVSGIPKALFQRVGSRVLS